MKEKGEVLDKFDAAMGPVAVGNLFNISESAVRGIRAKSQQQALITRHFSNRHKQEDTPPAVVAERDEDDLFEYDNVAPEDWGNEFEGFVLADFSGARGEQRAALPDSRLQPAQLWPPRRESHPTLCRRSGTHFPAPHVTFVHAKRLTVSVSVSLVSDYQGL
ncbi:hypothetical protein GWK47_008621 [Chionoecetes opilio]|uniref:Uncharacterized protein n=1 Tax=Chionoecetes opilio TaxID=41210 RepID=A0A8J4Y3K9_CHIOP|nr:hypothetical protein GWK47_008621 [Chionoecetes opilio]